jgi:hypothetical protein
MVDSHKSKVGFNNILSEDLFEELPSFKGLAQLREHVKEKIESINELNTVKINLLSNDNFKKEPTLPCMLQYLEDNQIYYDLEISSDEASFLIWMNELKKEFSNCLQ